MPDFRVFVQLSQAYVANSALDSQELSLLQLYKAYEIYNNV